MKWAATTLTRAGVFYLFEYNGLASRSDYLQYNLDRKENQHQ